MGKNTVNIQNAKRVVIKIGSSLLVDRETGKMRKSWLSSLVEDVVRMRKRGQEVIIVSSGAVALGREFINVPRVKLKLEEKQAAAACGQTRLVKNFQERFRKHRYNVAQILITLQDTESRRRYLNAKNTFETLLAVGVIPVVNENDTVATTELRFGDNDRLAARIAQMVRANALILLSDVDGLYSEDPRLNPDARFYPVVEEITSRICKMGGNSLSDVGSGGMITKIEAAKIAVSSGCETIITKGHLKYPVKTLETGGKCTRFLANESPIKARKHWIATSLHTKGEVVIDKGAVKALQNGKSLLPAGVIDIRGEFGRGDAVLIRDCQLRTIGKGLVAYSLKDARLIMGQQSSEIEHIVGFAGRNELIHRDDLALLEEENES